MFHFRIVSVKELKEIRVHETDILSRLRYSRELPLGTKIIHIGEENMFGPMEFGDRVPDWFLMDFHDLYNIDDMFLESGNYAPGGRFYNYTVRFLGAFENGIYQGGVWTFNRIGDSASYGLYGLRDSVANLLQGKKRVTRSLIEYNQNLGWFKTMFILDPPNTIVGILTDMGFHRSRKICSSENILLAPVATTYNYWSKDVPSVTNIYYRDQR